MFLVNTKRVLKSGFVNFWRNGFVSAASILVMTLALSVIASLFYGRALLNSTLDGIKQKVDINVYFTTSASDGEISALLKKVQAMPEVSSATLSTSDQELQAFKDRHQNDQLTLQALDEIGTNPLGASLNIKAKDPTDYEGIAQFLDTQKQNSQASIIDKFNYNRNKAAIDALSKIISSSKKLGILLVIFFASVAILITFNTISINIYMAKEEISVKRLVGASNRYIKGPFMVVGMMYGVISTILALLLLAPIAYWAGPYTFNLGTGINLWNHYLSTLFSTTLILLASGLVIGSLSSYLAVKKYLKI